MPRTTINYRNGGIIYKLVCRDNNIKDCYVGFTTNFVNRKYVHKRTYYNIIPCKHKHTLYDFIRNNGGWDNWNMVEVEHYKCWTSGEANKKVSEWANVLNANLY